MFQIAQPFTALMTRGVLKNAIDLMGFNEFQGKVVGLIGVAGGSTGAINGLNGLRTVGRALRAWVIPNQVSIPQAWEAFDKAGQLKDSNLDQLCRKSLA